MNITKSSRYIVDDDMRLIKYSSHIVFGSGETKEEAIKSYLDSVNEEIESMKKRLEILHEIKQEAEDFINTGLPFVTVK